MLQLPAKAVRGWATQTIAKIKTGSRKRAGGCGEGFPQSPGASTNATVYRKSFVLEHSGSRHLEDVYEVQQGKELGAGGFGTVRRASLKGTLTMTRAVKTIKKANMQAEGLVRREIAILRHLDHPCICRLLETFEDSRYVYLVMELIDGRELFDEIVERGSLDERRASGIMQQVFSAVQYCHEHHIIHRDIKPENIMVRSSRSPRAREDIPEVKLIDFGMAVMHDNQSPLGGGGSMMGGGDYLAPEAQRGRCTAASDIWSVGMVLHALLVGTLPKSSDLSQGKPVTEASGWEGVSPAARELVQALLQVQPSLRLTAAAAAGHAWTRGIAPVPLSPKHVNHMIENFTTFHKSSKLRRAALTALAMQLTNHQLDAQFEEQRAQFIAMDSDGNGRISKQELIDSIAAKSTCCAEEVHKWAESVFDSIDTDGSDSIDYTEWLAAAVRESTFRSEEAMRAAFRAFDADGDGRIDECEFARVLMQTTQEVASLLPDFDINGDGVIDFEEFKHLLLSGAAGAGPSTLSRQPSTVSNLPSMKMSL
jgi:calcium-dependent protein kinase